MNPPPSNFPPAGNSPSNPDSRNVEAGTTNPETAGCGNRPSLRLRANRGAFPALDAPPSTQRTPANSSGARLSPPLPTAAPVAQNATAAQASADEEGFEETAGPLLRFVVFVLLFACAGSNWLGEARSNPGADASYLIGYVLSACFFVPGVLTFLARRSSRFQGPRGQWKAFALSLVVMTMVGAGQLARESRGSAPAVHLALSPSADWTSVMDQKMKAQVAAQGGDLFDFSRSRNSGLYARFVSMVGGASSAANRRDAVAGYLDGCQRNGLTVLGQRDVTVAGIAAKEIRSTGPAGERLAVMVWTRDMVHSLVFDGPGPLSVEQASVRAYLARLSTIPVDSSRRR